MKAFACIAVVILHTFYAADAMAQTASQHAAMMSVRNLMTWSVPCFVMASGALLLAPERNIDLKKLFSKYISRMVIALVLFSMLFALFDQLLVSHTSGAVFFTDGLKAIFTGSGWKHMWFLYLMIAIYLLLPLYKIITKHADKKELLYLLGVYGIFLSVLPFIETISGLKLPFYICVSTVYPLYLFLGYVLHNRMIKIQRPVAVGAILIYTIVTVVLTVYNANIETPAIKELLNSYSFPAVVIGSVGVYALFASYEAKEHKIADRIFNEIDKCSFGIYLVHMAVLKFVIVVMKWNPFTNGGFLSVLIMTCIVFIVSFVIIRILKFIPKLEEII